MSDNRDGMPPSDEKQCSESGSKTVCEEPPNNEEELWQKVQTYIRDRLGMKRYSIWFKQTELMEVKNDHIVVGVPNVIVQQYLQQRYSGPVTEAIEELRGHPLEVKFEVEPGLFREMRKKRDQAARDAEQTRPELDFRPPSQDSEDQTAGVTFDELVVTESNRLPYIAAREVGAQQTPRISFLLLWGSYGSGKSALLQAVKNTALECEQLNNVCFTTAENWCNEYYYALQEKNTRRFRRRYRSCDLFILDDIHFVEGKPAAQDELLHTIKHHMDRGRRVVLSSARKPSEMKELKPALKTLLREAFWAELACPSAEEQEELVRELADRAGLNATPAVYRFIAGNRPRSLRELSCRVNSLAAYAALEGSSEVDINTAVRGLSAMARSGDDPLTLDQIAEAVAKTLSVKMKELKSDSRAHRVARARHVAMFLAEDLTDASVSEIGRFFGRSHSTVKYGVDKISDKVESEKDTADLIDNIRTRLQQV